MDPYSTHVPILKELAKTHTIRSVVEFGCGNYSTKLFLDREFFPHVEEVLSLESDAEWARNLEGIVGDGRLTMKVDSEENLLGVLDSLAPKRFDLALVDGASWEYRKPSFLVACKHADIIVVHDTETWATTEGFLEGSHEKQEYREMNPCTTVWVIRKEKSNV